MHVLHISNDYIGSKVHVSLYTELGSRGIKQTIYCPIRHATYAGLNNIAIEGTEVIYDYIIKPYHRYFYHLKRRKLFQSLQGKVNLKDIDVCHAATLMSDGGLAYKIYKKYNIPYIVAVRTTDYSFLKKAPNTLLSLKEILQNASRIIFVSPSLKEKFCNHGFVRMFLSRIEEKIVLLENGIDDYWINHVNTNETAKSPNILYVGTLIRRKHPLSLIEAVLDLKEDYPDIKLTIIGSRGEDEQAVVDYAKKNPDVIEYPGRINDKKDLMDIYRNNSLFALPSEGETFGLVYLEALSQNLPVIYTKGTGIDGVLSENNGIGLVTLNVECIKSAIRKILENRTDYSNKNIDFEEFRWCNIADKYIKIYHGL